MVTTLICIPQLYGCARTYADNTVHMHHWPEEQGATTRGAGCYGGGAGCYGHCRLQFFTENSGLNLLDDSLSVVMV